MIEPIITYLNALLTPLGFRTFPLTGLVERGDATFPAVYLRGGEYQAINAEVPTVYHRLLDGPNDTDDEDDESPVNNSIVTRTYSLRAVAIFPHDLYGDDDQYLEDKVIRNLAGQLKHRNIKTLKNTLELVEVSTIPGASARGREAWGEEFDGIEYVEKRRIVYVDYTLTLRGFSNCLDAVGCGDADIDVRQAIIDEYCTDGDCDPASITTNGDSPALEVASGATQDIAIHDTAGADVGTRSGATVTIADGTVTVNGAGSIAAKAEGTTNVNVENSAGTDVGTLAGSTVTVADADVNVNGSDYGSVVAEGAINVQVVDESDNPVGSLSGGKWVVPPVLGVGLSAKLMKSGQTTSYATGDDGDLEPGRNVDFFTLAAANPFGNTNRFTDELGGSTYTNGIVIDWSTYDGSEVLGWAKAPIIGNITWASALTAAASATYGSFSTGWRLPNIVEHLSLTNYEDTQYTDYMPFGPQGLGVKSWWTSTTYAGSTSTAFVLRESGVLLVVNKTLTSNRYQPVRTFTVTGTTLS